MCVCVCVCVCVCARARGVRQYKSLLLLLALGCYGTDLLLQVLRPWRWLGQPKEHQITDMPYTCRIPQNCPLVNVRYGTSFTPSTPNVTRIFCQPWVTKKGDPSSLWLVPYLLGGTLGPSYRNGAANSEVRSDRIDV